MRTFISIEIPEDIKKKIVEIQKQLPKFNGKKTEPENIHLTLKFLGEVDEKKANGVKKKLREIKFRTFDAEIDSIGIFSDRIIWLGIKNCEKLQKEIDYKLEGLFEREKRFMGHLTIARVKSIQDKKKFLNELKNIKIQPQKFRINSFNLRNSLLTKKGPIYETLEEYNLN